MADLDVIEALLVRLLRPDLRFPMPEPSPCACPPAMALPAPAWIGVARCLRCWGVV